MTNTEFKAMNNEELAMITGGSEYPSNPIDFIIKGFQHKVVKKECKKIGIRAIQAAGTAANDIINTVRGWF